MTSSLVSSNFDLHARLIPSQTSGMLVFESTALCYVDSGLACDTFNIIHVRSGDSLTPGKLGFTVSHYRRKNFPFCLWVNKENLDDHTTSLFASIGLKQLNQEVAMVLDLQALDEQPVMQSPTIRVVKQEDELNDFATVIAANWKPADQHVIRYFQQTSAAWLHPDNRITLLVYYENDLPVATIEMFPGPAGAVGLYSLATLTSYRGRGIGSALFNAALALAKRQGYRHAVLQASEDGIGIYRRMGFSEVSVYYEYA